MKLFQVKKCCSFYLDMGTYVFYNYCNAALLIYWKENLWILISN